jgi:hypothetical protein
LKDGVSTAAKRYFSVGREREVRLAFTTAGEYESQCVAIGSSAAKIGLHKSEIIRRLSFRQPIRRIIDRVCFGARPGRHAMRIEHMAGV